MRTIWGKLILSLVFIAIIFYVYREVFDKKYANERNKNFIASCRRDIENQEWKGIVIDTLTDKKNHNIPTIYIKPIVGQAYIVTLSCYDKELMQILEIGDTINKPLGEVKCKVQKKFEVVFFDPQLFRNK